MALKSSPQPKSSRQATELYSQEPDEEGIALVVSMQESGVVEDAVLSV